MEELKKFLEEIAKDDPRCEQEGFNPYDDFGGNMDDSFYGGMEDGRIYLAKAILEEFFNKPLGITE